MSTNRLRPAAFVVLRAESSASGGGRGLREGVGIAKGRVRFITSLQWHAVWTSVRQYG